MSSRGLLVASHDGGSVAVLRTPSLRLAEELPCPDCRIYDVAVLPDQHIVVAQGKRRKLSKLRPEGGIVKEVSLALTASSLPQAKAIC